MNVLTLKVIALITMIIDHYGAIFQSDVMFYRMIGRIAFPIYCFLLVEGYFHTRDVKKYIKRLFIFALISEIPFDLAFYNKIGFVHQNIFFTLTIGLVAIHFLENKEGKYNFNKNTTVIVACILSIILNVDYNVIGIGYILVFYYSKNHEKLKRLKMVSFVMLLLNLMSSIIQQLSLLSLPLLYYYNNKLGPKNKLIQFSFYTAYPVHLLIFYIIKII